MTAEHKMAVARLICRRVMALADAGDEVEVLDGFLMRLELGRQRYGALDLRKNKHDWDAECDEEVADWAVYRAFKRTSNRQAQVDAIETGLVELAEPVSDRTLKEALIAFDLSDGGEP